jgi:hypothetical protein
VLADRADAAAVHRELLAAGTPHGLLIGVRVVLAEVLDRLPQDGHLAVRAMPARHGVRLELVVLAGRLAGGWPLQAIAELADRWGLRLSAETGVLWLELDR